MPVALDVDRLEFAVLAQKSGITRVPVVAAYGHHGTTVGDVRGAFDAAEDRCHHRGLLMRGEVRTDAAELLNLYQHAEVEYDLRFSVEQGTELRAAVTRSGRDAVRTVVDGDRVHLEEVRGSEAIAALVSVLPERPPARVRPTGVDSEALTAVMKQHPDGDQTTIEAGLRSHRADTREYRRAAQLLDGPKLGVGQVGVTIWDHLRREHRGQHTMQVIDIPSGRVGVYDSRGQRMIAGADLATFIRVLDDITTDTRHDIQR